MTAFASRRRDILRAGAPRRRSALIGGKLRAADAAGRTLPEGDAYAPWTLWNDPSICQHAAGAGRRRRARRQSARHAAVAVRPSATTRSPSTPTPSRNLGAMDADLRELHLGLGCAIENMLTRGLLQRLRGAAGDHRQVRGSTDGAQRAVLAAPAAIATDRRGRSRVALRRHSRFATPTATPTIPARARRPPRGATSRGRSSSRQGQGLSVRSRFAAAQALSTPPSPRRRRRSSPTSR